MSTTIQKKQFKKINARTVDDLINNIRNTNISQSEIIDKLNMDNDFSKVLKQTPNDEVNILAENLINKNYFKALRTLQEEHPTIKIFNLMDDIKTQEYIRFLYIIPKEEVLYSDVEGVGKNIIFDVNALQMPPRVCMDNLVRVHPIR